MSRDTFTFKQFEILHDADVHRVGTDAVLLGAWADASGASTVVDIGCGSGVIALMMAQRYPGAHVIAVDVSPAACSCAGGNAARSPWASRVEVRECDWLADCRALPVTPPVCYVSNPPFFNEALRSPERGRALARHGEGFNVDTLLRSFADIAGRADTLAFVATASRRDEIMLLCEQCALDLARVCMVHSSEEAPARRVLWQVRPHAVGAPGPETTRLVINSPAYITLTSPFYLDK